MELSDLTLYETPSDRLDAWIAQCLLPDEEFRQQIREATRRIVEFLKTGCFRDATVYKVVKGGSSGKGTALKNGSDADLVVFLSCFTSFKDQTEERGDVIQEIHEMLNKCRKSIAYDIEIKEPKEKYDPEGQLLQPRSLSFDIQSRKVMESISVDVLPAYNALGSVSANVKPDPEVYISLIKARGRPGEFSPCFTELQRNFVKRRPGKLKNLIRLVKHWYMEYVKIKYKGFSLPPKYALELLTIYAWEKGSVADDFCTEEGFCTVLELLCQYQKLCIYWTTNYDFKNRVVGNFMRRQLRKPRPVILDPADPTGIVGHGASWDLVALEAEACLQENCCQNCEGSVEGWGVKPVVKFPGFRTAPQKKQFYVRNPNVRTDTYRVRARLMIEKHVNIPVDQQRLTYSNQELEGHNTLGFYRIANKHDYWDTEQNASQDSVYLKPCSSIWESSPEAAAQNRSIIPDRPIQGGGIRDIAREEPRRSCKEVCEDSLESGTETPEERRVLWTSTLEREVGTGEHGGQRCSSAPSHTPGGVCLKQNYDWDTEQNASQDSMYLRPCSFNWESSPEAAAQNRSIILDRSIQRGGIRDVAREEPGRRRKEVCEDSLESGTQTPEERRVLRTSTLEGEVGTGEHGGQRYSSAPSHAPRGAWLKQLWERILGWIGRRASASE